MYDTTTVQDTTSAMPRPGTVEIESQYEILQGGWKASCREHRPIFESCIAAVPIPATAVSSYPKPYIKNT